MLRRVVRTIGGPELSMLLSSDAVDEDIIRLVDEESLQLMFPLRCKRSRYHDEVRSIRKWVVSAEVWAFD